MNDSRMSQKKQDASVGWIQFARVLLSLKTWELVATYVTSRRTYAPGMHGNFSDSRDERVI
jgi:hypothetical protein